MGQRPARRECRPRHDADAGCRNPEDTARISNLLPPAVLDGGICLLVQQLHKQLLLRLQRLPLRVHQYVPHLLLLRRAVMQCQMVLRQRALRHGGRPHIGRGQILQNRELAAPLIHMDAAVRVRMPAQAAVLTAGQLDELGRLEAAEHLAYCDKCADRYTALLPADALADPPRDVRRTVMSTIWVRLMQNTWGRAAVAGVAAVLAFTMWRSGAIDQLLHFRQELHTWTPETSQSQTEEPAQLGKPMEDGRPSAQPEILGKPMDDDKPKQQASLAKALNDLLFGAGGPAAEKYKNSPLADQTK